MQLKQSFSVLAVILLLASCQETSYKDDFMVFGSIVSIEIVGEEKSKAAQASKQIQTMFDGMHTKWHAWEKGGLLAKINDAIATEQTIVLNPEVVDFLKEIKMLSRKSDYYFNPAIGKLVALWGFHADSPEKTIPSDSDIQRLTQPMLRMDSLAFDGETLVSIDPRVQLDLGAVAKGYAVDLAIAVLKKQGIKNAVVNAGGDLRVLGKKAPDKPWHIGVRNASGGLAGELDAYDNEAIVSSGDYERAYTIKDKKAHHIISPITGKPSTGISAVTVIISNHKTPAMYADVVATAIMVAGKEKWKAVAKKMGVELVLIIEDTGTIQMTKKMQQRLKKP